MHEDGWDPTTVQPIQQHVQLIIGEVTAREAQGLVCPLPSNLNQLRVFKHLIHTNLH